MAQVFKLRRQPRRELSWLLWWFLQCFSYQTCTFKSYSQLRKLHPTLPPTQQGAKLINTSNRRRKQRENRSWVVIRYWTADKMSYRAGLVLPRRRSVCLVTADWTWNCANLPAHTPFVVIVCAALWMGCAMCVLKRGVTLCNEAVNNVLGCQVFNIA